MTTATATPPAAPVDPNVVNLVIDGKAVTNTSELSAAMDKYTLNDTVKLQFLREGRTVQEVEIKLTLQR